MKTNQLVTIVAALISAAGTAVAGDSAEPGSSLFDSIRPQTAEFTPMTRSERFRLYLTGTFGPGSLAKASVNAGIGQLTDHPKEWGQGAGGYADRLGNGYAKHIINGTLAYGAASLLHEDDRYLPSGQTGLWARAGYAVSSAFLARRDNGQRCFAFARMGGAAGAAFISRTWQPASTSGAGNSAASLGFMVATDVGGNVFREFWPDIKRHLRKK